MRHCQEEVIPTRRVCRKKERKERQLVKVNLRSSLSKCHVAAIHSALGAPGRCRDGGCHLPSSYHSSWQLTGTPAANPQTSAGVQLATNTEACKYKHLPLKKLDHCLKARSHVTCDFNTEFRDSLRRLSLDASRLIWKRPPSLMDLAGIRF